MHRTFGVVIVVKKNKKGVGGGFGG